MTYAVEPELTKQDTALHNEEGGFLTVLKEGGGTVLAPPLVNDRNPNAVAFVLISHGESGKVTGASVSPHKQENLDDNFTFMESTQCDDILRWESRDQFLKHYVKLHR